jgi:hypothetical protein
MLNHFLVTTQVARKSGAFLVCLLNISSLLQLFVSFHTDPSGTYIRVEYKAIGAAAEGAQNILAEEYFKVRLSWSMQLD